MTPNTVTRRAYQDWIHILLHTHVRKLLEITHCRQIDVSNALQRRASSCDFHEFLVAHFCSDCVHVSDFVLHVARNRRLVISRQNSRSRFVAGGRAGNPACIRCDWCYPTSRRGSRWRRRALWRRGFWRLCSDRLATFTARLVALLGIRSCGQACEAWLRMTKARFAKVIPQVCVIKMVTDQ